VRIESTKPERSCRGTQNPPVATRGERESTVAGLDVGEQALHAGAQKRKTVGIIVLLANHDEAGLRVTLKNICQERAGGGLAACASMSKPGL